MSSCKRETHKLTNNKISLRLWIYIPHIAVFFVQFLRIENVVRITNHVDDGIRLKMTQIPTTYFQLKLLTRPTFSIDRCRVTSSIHFRLGRLCLNAWRTSCTIARAFVLLSPWNTSRTNIDATAKPITLSVAPTHSFHFSSLPSTPATRSTHHHDVRTIQMHTLRV